jgi:hypothetical protein
MAGLGAAVLMGHERAFRITPGPGIQITDSTSRPSPQAGACANRGSSALAPPLGTKKRVGDDQLSAGQLLNLSHNQGSLNCLSRTANF